ncbi:MAG: hypothetical protein A2V86_14700 [Deltaproteobacteria bacterium RBG_16_49_23]|nr:MAG: hypothetical protein A2V86_14700 [Deltaproteobacteria bacterium RBG_16_49_23]
MRSLRRLTRRQNWRSSATLHKVLRSQNDSFPHAFINGKAKSNWELQGLLGLAAFIFKIFVREVRGSPMQTYPGGNAPLALTFFRIS